MTDKEIDKLEIKEARKVLKNIFRSPLLDMWIANQKQIHRISEQIENADIRFEDSESPMYDNFLKWQDKALKMADAQSLIESRLDPTVLEREKRKRLAPDRNTPEWYAKRRKENIINGD